jgi:hypothetical protein
MNYTYHDDISSIFDRFWHSRHTGTLPGGGLHMGKGVYIQHTSYVWLHIGYICAYIATYRVHAGEIWLQITYWLNTATYRLLETTNLAGPCWLGLPRTFLTSVHCIVCLHTAHNRCREGYLRVLVQAYSAAPSGLQMKMGLVRIPWAVTVHSYHDVSYAGSIVSIRSKFML